MTQAAERIEHDPDAATSEPQSDMMAVTRTFGAVAVAFFAVVVAAALLASIL